jgi:hypothetical protein
MHPAIYFERPLRQATPGQWIRSWNGMVWHHGIVTGVWLNPATNVWQIVVTHAIPNAGVVATTLEGFCEGRLIEIVAQPLSEEHQRLILKTAQANLGKSYTLFNQNCEHFASGGYPLDFPETLHH